MTFGSLFSGFGGMDLGLERAGLKCWWQVEINKYAQGVLKKHWPKVTQWSDVRVAGFNTLEPVDLICGGFPCQGISNAGEREGLADERSGLWKEFIRIVRELRPHYVLVENVGALTVRGLQRVLGDLCESGFDAEWATLSAASFGAVHRRERLFIVAYTTGNRLEGRITTARAGEESVATLDNLHDWPALSEPFGIRSTNGVPCFVERITGLGNAVVPQVAEWIGRRILEAEERNQAQ
jgi:DNA (cytosine-5)-methyltransferase 1